MEAPKCDECGYTDFYVVRCKQPPILIPASKFFGKSQPWWDKELHGNSKYKAMCRACGTTFEWNENHDLPVMD